MLKLDILTFFGPAYLYNFVDLNKYCLSVGMATPQRGTPVIVRSQKTSQSTPASQISQAAKSVEDEFEDFPLSAMELDMAMADMEEGSAW